MTETLLVTGAGGALGRRVVELLLERGLEVVATTRDPSKLASLAARGVRVRAADFDDEATLPAAFAGVTRALLVSTNALDGTDRRRRHQRHAVAALVAAGAQHIVYTSMPRPVGSPVPFAPDHAGTEDALAASGVDFTVLRNNLYTDYLIPQLVPALASGVLVDAKGEAGVAYVTRDDCARAAAGALVGARGKHTVDVTGPAAIGGAELAAISSALAGRPIAHRSVSDQALVEGLVTRGVAPVMAAILASFDRAAARGDLAPITTAVKDLGGVEPTSVATFLAANRTALVDLGPGPAGAH